MLLVNILFGLVSSISLCDKYTTALFTNNTSENQQTLVTLVVNTAIIGNYTKGAKNVVPGILAPDGDLLKFFDGSMSTTNENGIPTKVNFLDDGGAGPLLLNKPANGTNSRQYTLVTHLYEVFGSLLECSQQSNTNVFKLYDGDTSMFEVHRFMKLNNTQVLYFIKQVGLSALSFGVSTDDVKTVGDALTNLFLMRCTAPVSLVPGVSPALQSICNSDDCPLAQNPACESYTTPTSTSRKPTKTNSAITIKGSLLVTLASVFAMVL